MECRYYVVMGYLRRHLRNMQKLFERAIDWVSGNTISESVFSWRMAIHISYYDVHKYLG